MTNELIKAKYLEITFGGKWSYIALGHWVSDDKKREVKREYNSKEKKVSYFLINNETNAKFEFQFNKEANLIQSEHQKIKNHNVMDELALNSCVNLALVNYQTVKSFASKQFENIKPVLDRRQNRKATYEK